MEKDPLTYAIIGCAMKVYNKLGPGFQEVIYARALAIELSRAGLQHNLVFNPKYYPNYKKRENQNF